MMRPMRWLAAALLAAASASPACAQAPDIAPTEQVLQAADDNIVRMGRTVTTPGSALRFGYPGVTLRVAFEGTHLAMDASGSGNSVLDVSVDGGKPFVLRLGTSNGPIDLVNNAAPGRHTVELVHRTETWLGTPEIRYFFTDGTFVAAAPLPARKLLVLGDSVTCGADMERTAGDKNDPMWWNARESYGMLAARALDAQVQLVCYGGRGLVRSWNGRSDEWQLPAFYGLALPILIADANYSIKWKQADYHPDLILVAIGTNDFTEGIPDHAAYVAAYSAFLRTLLADHSAAQVVLTEGAILNGEKKAALTAWLQEIVKSSASPRVHYLKSLHHPGDERDAHPTTLQHAEMARELAPPLRRLMGW
jgi:lysophospholipase L1-like esterase